MVGGEILFYEENHKVTAKEKPTVSKQESLRDCRLLTTLLSIFAIRYKPSVK